MTERGSLAGDLQGQISVPVEIRRKLGVGPGSVLEWEQDGDT
jgi:bifunctional DNA-binding transcriptional regulator/antitoxin component of YhaV-PrlF toxin-antitoxin module